ncbi:MAG: hypothetical protein E7K48_08515, partial [Varibaculum cambriense]|nr:hypothetical protein [Varibaculum cambriense]
YATPAATSAVIMVVFFKLGMPVLGMALSIITALVFVLLSQWRGWVLPEAPDIRITLTPRQLRQILRWRDKNNARKTTGADDLSSEGNGYPKATDSRENSANSPATDSGI